MALKSVSTSIINVRGRGIIVTGPVIGLVASGLDTYGRNRLEYTRFLNL